ncbi:MAG TPA: anti-sigma factor [Bradyrhizobium sp.]|nr:anti-sigma factor [Bradyrhizobium sp.]
MVVSLRDNDDLQLNAYCDGELDPVSAGEFERRLASDASLKARYDRLSSLRQAVRSLPQIDLPAGLQARIRAKLDTERPSNVVVLRRRSWSFQALAAAALFGAVISGSVMMTIEQYAQRENLAGQVVADHIRGLLAPQPFDIASSDRHTVKPWFTARLPQSPQVPDLAAQGFTLLGGRVDVIGHDPVATIVYKHAAHTVSLTTLRPGQSVSEQTIAGYNVRSWSDVNFTYVAVSDLPGADLAAFERAFVAAEPSPEIK